MIYGIAENPRPTGKCVKYIPAAWGSRRVDDKYEECTSKWKCSGDDPLPLFLLPWRGSWGCNPAHASIHKMDQEQQLFHLTHLALNGFFGSSLFSQCFSVLLGHLRWSVVYIDGGMVFIDVFFST